MAGERISVGTRSLADPTVEATDGVTQGGGAGAIASPPCAGESIGRYVVLHPIGAGGMGFVVAAYDPQLDRKVAVKLLRHGPSTSDDDAVKTRSLLLEEARALAQLSHPNVIAVHDVGLHHGRVFVAMEFVDGTTVSRWQDELEHDIAEIVRVYADAGEGLSAAHRAGLVHRDFKPDNVMIDREGRVRVLDFGLARATEADPSYGVAPTTSRSTEGLAGTPAYMAPEQFAGRRADARSDQFSFCVALHEAVYRERPFQGTNVAALAVSTLEEAPSIPVTRNVPDSLSSVIQRGLEKNPADRFAGMDDLLRVLRAALAPKPRRALRLGAAGLLAGTIATGAILWPETVDACATTGETSTVWGDAQAAALRTALHSPLDPEDRLFESLREHLDRYADSLGSAEVSACRDAQAERVDAELQSARSRCLARRTAALRNTIDYMVATPDRVRADMTAIVGSLRPASRCADPHLNDTTEPSASHETVDALLVRVDAAALRLSAGEIAAVEPEADAVVAEAHRQGLAWPEARARRLVASTLRAKGETLEAIAAYRAAYAASIAAGDVIGAFNNAVELAMLLSYDVRDLEGGAFWLAVADASARQFRLGPMDATRLFVTKGVSAWVREDYEAAREAYQRAFDLCNDNGGTTRCITPLADLAESTLMVGNPDGAKNLFREVLSRHNAAYGEDNPQYSLLLSRFGATLGVAGEHEEGFEYAARAAAIGDRVWGPESPSMIPLLGNLSTVALRVGEVERGREALRRAEELTRNRHGGDHPLMSYALASRANYALHDKQWHSAIADLRQVLALREGSFDAGGPALLVPKTDLAEALFMAGDSTAALAQVSEAADGCNAESCRAIAARAASLQVEILVAQGERGRASAVLAELEARADPPEAEQHRRVARWALRPSGVDVDALIVDVETRRGSSTPLLDRLRRTR